MRLTSNFLILFLFCICQSLSAQDTTLTVTPFDMRKTADLDQLVKLIGDKKVVAIGEDTHGTSEYYEFRSALTQKLIKEKGFNVFILENPHEDLMVLQENLFRFPIDTLMKRHLFSIYQTQEMKSFLVWLKTWVRTHKTFKIAGSDDSYREILPVLLRRELKPYKNKRMNDLAADFEHRQLMDIEEYYGQTGIFKPDSLPDDLKFGLETFQNLQLLDSLYKRQPRKNVLLEELLFHALSNYRIYSHFSQGAYLSRDETMGLRSNYYAAKKGAKVIIWAHDAHIAKTPLGGEIGLMGTTIAKANKENYFAIGLSTVEGTYSYMKNQFINDDHVYDDTLFTKSFLEPKANSWNALFRRQPLEGFMINFAALPQADSVIYSMKRPFRVVGYSEEQPGKGTWYDVRMAGLYDVLVVRRETKGTKALPR